MTNAEIVNAFINGLVAVGTLLLAILAVYGDWLRSRFTGSILTLVLENPKGSLLRQASIYYQLKVVNRRPSTPATSCRVQLRSLKRRAEKGDFVEVRLPYPLVMSWPPSEYTAWTITLVREEAVDFGMLHKGDSFTTAAKVIPTIMAEQLKLKAGQTMRYGFEIVSDQFVSPTLQEFEVSWNGEWSDNIDEMPNNLQIRAVKN